MLKTIEEDIRLKILKQNYIMSEINFKSTSRSSTQIVLKFSDTVHVCIRSSFQ